MSIKNFKFVSPGVFINEIDESFITEPPPNIGPVVIGRAEKGLAMQPIRVESYQEFVEQFGETVPGRVEAMCIAMETTNLQCIVHMQLKHSCVQT